MRRPKLIRITTVPISLKFLITGQMKYMSEHEYEVIMMSADGPEVDEVVEREGCPHEIIPLTRQITPLADLRALWILYRKLRKHRPDIVHTHTPKAGLIGMMAAWMARVPVRLHTVAGLPLESATGVKRKILLAVERLTYQCATEVWPNSISLKSFIVDHRLTTPSKLRIIGHGSSNGIDISEFDPSTLDETLLNDIKEKIQYDSSYRYLLFVGRVVKDKGIEELVSAFSHIKPKYPNLKLILVGPLEEHLDPLSPTTMKRISEDKDIIAVGFSNQVKYYMHLAELFVFPSHREGFPNVPMQAGLMGCPVVASRITGNVDIIEDGVDGLLHEKGNEEDLIEKMSYALNHPSDMKSKVERLKQKIISYFDREVVQKQILATYRQHLTSSETTP